MYKTHIFRLWWKINFSGKKYFGEDCFLVENVQWETFVDEKKLVENFGGNALFDIY